MQSPYAASYNHSSARAHFCLAAAEGHESWHIYANLQTDVHQPVVAIDKHSINPEFTSLLAGIQYFMSSMAHSMD